MAGVPRRVTDSPRLLVIGVGNAYRRDDAAGLLVAQRLAKAFSGEADRVTIREESGDCLGLIEAWQEAAAVILIDAVSSGAAPGTWYRFDVSRQVLPTGFFGCSTHAFGVAEAIELARAFDQLPPRLIVYGLEGETFAAGTGLSLAVESAVDEVVTRVRHEIRRLAAEKQQ